MRWAEHVAHMMGGEQCIAVQENQKPKDHLEDTRRKWADNIKMDLRKL